MDIILLFNDNMKNPKSVVEVEVPAMRNGNQSDLQLCSALTCKHMPSFIFSRLLNYKTEGKLYFRQES
jgi:hypothetical protein